MPRRRLLAGSLSTVALFGLVVFAVCVPLAGASSKFAYSESIESGNQGTNLVVQFEEGSLKRFDAVSYQLDARAVATASCTGGQMVSQQFFPSVTLEGLVPDAKGRVAATGTLSIAASSGSLCPGNQLRVEYSDVLLTNLTTGHVYRLDPVSRNFP